MDCKRDARYRYIIDSGDTYAVIVRMDDIYLFKENVH